MSPHIAQLQCKDSNFLRFCNIRPGIRILEVQLQEV